MFLSDALGWTALVIIATTIMTIAHLRPAIAYFIISAFLLRAGAVLTHRYIMPLPDSSVDAATFEILAADWANLHGISIVGEVPIGGSYLISWVIAIIYALTDRSLMMAQAISVALGTATVYFIYRLTFILWNDSDVAKRAGWIAALFPTLILYSALTMREAYVWFFLIIALIGVVQLVRENKFKYLLLTLGGFTGATLFHGGMIIGLLVLLILVIFRSLKKLTVLIMQHQLNIYTLLFLLLATIPIGAFISGIYSVPKIGSIDTLTDTNRLMYRLRSTTISRGNDGAAYPTWTVPNTPIELPIKGLVRSIYFLFSPFPWNVKKLSHLFGLFDAILYAILASLLYKNRKNIRKDKAAKIIFFIFLAYIIVFGFAIGNFGAGLRHRAKFLGMLIVLAAPKIKRIKISKHPID